MDETSNTWLNSLRDGGPRAVGWMRLVEAYGPFIQRILLSRGVAPEVTEDLVQNVMTVVARRLAEFERERTGSFRAWLRAITVNCLRDYRKSKRNARLYSEGFDEIIQAMDDPNSQLTKIWNQQHAHHTLGVLLESIQGEFSEKTIRAFRSLAIDEKPSEQVAQELGMTSNACLIARSRVLKRLRERLRDMFGDDEGFVELN